MDPINYLQYGAIGVAFVLAILSYRLLAKEQEREEVREPILKSIKYYLVLTLVLSCFFGVSEFVNNIYGNKKSIDDICGKYFNTYKDSTLSQKTNAIIKYIDSKQSCKDLGQLSAEINNGDFSIINTNGDSLGSIKGVNLEKIGVFNAFLDTILSRENHRYIKWTKEHDSKKWKKRRSFFKPFKMVVYDDNNRTCYQIKKNGNEVFNSTDYGNLFGKDKRLVHFLRDENDYYLLTISEANLTNQGKRKYVHIIYAKIEPTFQ